MLNAYFFLALRVICVLCIECFEEYSHYNDGVLIRKPNPRQASSRYVLFVGCYKCLSWLANIREHFSLLSKRVCMQVPQFRHQLAVDPDANYSGLWVHHFRESNLYMLDILVRYALSPVFQDRSKKAEKLPD